MAAVVVGVPRVLLQAGGLIERGAGRCCRVGDFQLGDLAEEVSRRVGGVGDLQELVIGDRVWWRLLDQNAQRLRQGAAVLAADFGFRSALSSGDIETLRSALENSGARIGAPITCLMLLLLAIPLGFVNPRAGSATNMIIALLIFITYLNLVGLLQASVSKGKLAFGLAWWPLHLVVALCAVFMFSLRLNVNHRYHPRMLLSSLKRRGKPCAKAGAA